MDARGSTRMLQRVGQGDLAHLLEDEDDRIEANIHHKDDFHSKRSRCITNPDRALETLAPYAKLELVIQAAVYLQPRLSWTTLSTTDPRVGVFVDDVKLEGKEFLTPVVRNTTSPLWRHKMVIDVLCPLSMVRLQVYDDQVTTRVEQGFVEFCVGDMPYDTPIKGWLELRFQDNLRNNSIKRYASHCAVREDHLDLPDQVDLAAESSLRNSGRSNLTHQVTMEDLKARKMVGVRALRKSQSMMQACSSGCSGTSSSSSKAAAAEQDRGNAGELYVEMRLSRVVGSFDSLFALALPMPTPASHGNYVDLEDEESQAKARRTLDLQKAMDTISDLRVRLLEDFLFCILYYLKYIAMWRHTVLSLPLFILGVICCWQTYYGIAIVPGTSAVLLVLNSWANCRRRMTRGGWNAAMTDAGFAQVASWKNSGEMFVYLKRLVENELSGSVADMPKLQTIARECFRDGVPTVSLKELKTLLRHKKDIINWDSGADGTFAKNDKVLVDGSRKATVVGMHPDGKRVLVAYEDGLAPEGVGAQGTGASEPVETPRVRKRQTIGFYQTWLLPTRISNTLADVTHTAGVIEKTKVYPILDFVTEVVTWRRKLLAAVLCLILLAVSAVIIFEELIFERWGLHVDQAHWVTSQMVIILLRNIDNGVELALVCTLFLFQAKWFACIRALLRCMGRKCREKRRAPEHWQFFRRDTGMQERLDHLPPMTWSGGVSMGDVKLVGEKLKSGAKSNVEDLQRKVAQLHKGVGNFQFKLPEEPP